jgi:cytoskeletal protein CcmA (bactofilin family)
VNGSIAADTVRVFGQVQGAILGAHVVLHPSAQVEGDIHSQSLTIEQGASFDGRSRKVTNAAEVAPQLENPESQTHAYG